MLTSSRGAHLSFFLMKGFGVHRLKSSRAQKGSRVCEGSILGLRGLRVSGFKGSWV